MIWPRRPSCIYVFSIAGPITEASALEFALRLRELPTRKPAACAVLLRVSSNGGSAEAIIEAVNLCREELGLPIVALVMETALSAGLLPALAADRLVVTPSATLGGAGAIVRLLSPSALLSARRGLHRLCQQCLEGHVQSLCRSGPGGGAGLA